MRAPGVFSLVIAAAAARKLPKAVVVNLPKHEARFEGVKQQLDEAGVKFERIGAVVGKQLSPEERRSNVTALARVLITPGMMGCFLSHRRCWERCVELNEDLLVFEDDILLEPEFSKRVCAAMDDLPEDWDVMLIGALGCVHPERKYGLLWLIHFLPSLVFLPFSGNRWKPRVSSAVHVPLRPAGTHAYVISPAGARKLLDACPKANYHVDVVAWGTRALQLYCVNPLLAKQTHGDTTIGGRRDFGWIADRTGPIVFDSYTGADLAWSYNIPLLRIGGDSWYILLSTGRCMSLYIAGVLASLLTRSRVLFALNSLVLVAQVVAVRLLLLFSGSARKPSLASARPHVIEI